MIVLQVPAVTARVVSTTLRPSSLGSDPGTSSSALLQSRFRQTGPQILPASLRGLIQYAFSEYFPLTLSSWEEKEMLAPISLQRTGKVQFLHNS